MATWLKKHSRQVLIGIVLAILPFIYFAYTDVSWKPLNPHEHVVQNGFAYLLLLLFSYFNHTVFVPRWFLGKQYSRYAIVAVGCVIGAAYFPYRIEQWFFFKPPLENTLSAWANQLFLEEMMLGRPPASHFHSRTDNRFHSHSTELSPPGEAPHFPDGPPPGLLKGNFRSRKSHADLPFSLTAKLAIFFLLGSVSTLLSVSLLTANRLRQVESDQLRAELLQLKAQIQPHFLFNTLNSIYALAIRKDDRTPETIVKLSEFMRYIIRDAHREYVSLVTEVNYIANYLDLQKARLQDAVEIDYQLEGDGSRLQIAPLILFSFIENAFKYGVNPEEDSLIVIHLTVQDNVLQLYVANNKVEVNHLEKSTGIGLQNTQERLRLLYPAVHELTIDDTPTHFRVNLLLTLS